MRLHIKVILQNILGLNMKSFTLPIILCSLAAFGLLEIFFPFFKYKQNYVSRIFANFALGIMNAGINALVVS